MQAWSWVEADVRPHVDMKETAFLKIVRASGAKDDGKKIWMCGRIRKQTSGRLGLARIGGQVGSEHSGKAA